MGDGKYMLRVGYLLSAAPAVEEQRFPTDAFADRFTLTEWHFLGRWQDAPHYKTLSRYTMFAHTEALVIIYSRCPVIEFPLSILFYN